MVEYTKPWLSLGQQVERLASRDLDVGHPDHAAAVLKSVGYYRLTGYLYPFRESELYSDDEGGTRTRVLSNHLPGTTLLHARPAVQSKAPVGPRGPRWGRFRSSTTSVTRRRPRASSARTMFSL